MANKQAYDPVLLYYEPHMMLNVYAYKLVKNES